MPRVVCRCCLVGLVAALGVVPVRAADKAPATLRFEKTQLDAKFRAEGVAVGDFNRDGRADIAHGEGYYAAPDWKFVPIREQAREFDPLKYSQCFQAFADDLNADGWLDLVVVEYPGKDTVWLENPQGAARPWARHVMVGVTNNESPTYVDVDGDRRAELVCGTAPTPETADGPDKVFAIARRGAEPEAPWTVTAISEKNVDMARKFFHGLGLGDLNGDGRTDVVTPAGWWQAPESPAESAWTFHEQKLGGPCAQMIVEDFDGDGDVDVLSSSAHQVGIWYHERTADGWRTHEIENRFTQTHALAAADLNGDGLTDFVTGKRYWAHGPKGDINPGDPAVMYWFELRREHGAARWIPHAFDADSGVGTQFELADVDGDGLTDVVTSNKKGTFYFRQVRE